MVGCNMCTDFRQALVLEPTNKQAIEAVKRLKKLLYE